MKRYATITGMVVCLLSVANIAQASTHHPTGITQAQAAKQYLADVAPGNALPESTKAPAYAAAVHKLDTLLLSQRWPSRTYADIRALVVADAAVVRDYNASPSSNILNGSALNATTQKDLEADTTAANIVRSDLGLPPVGGAETIGWSLFGLWTVTGRWELAGVVAIALAVGVAMCLAVLLLPEEEQKSKHKTLFSVVGWVVGLLLLADIVLVVEGIAHIIWPNFVDTGA
jgi:hypothetical protein